MSVKKKFANGDAGDEWKESVKFSVDLSENSLLYGMKYSEMRGVITKVDLLEGNKYRIYVLNYWDSPSHFIQHNSFIEILIDNKLKMLYGPVLGGMNIDDSNKLLEFVPD